MNAYDISDKYRMLSRDEVDLIKKCVKFLPTNPTILNIGANVGTSTCAMLDANPDAFIYSIDKKDCPDEIQNVIACDHNSDQVYQIVGNTKKFDVSQLGTKIDMSFIDGGHDDETLKNDIEKFIPITRHIVLFHDYHHPRYAANPNINLDTIVDEAMKDWERIGEARYLVAFRRKNG